MGSHYAALRSAHQSWGSPLPEHLRDWVDWDGAAYWLAVTLGLMKDEPGLFQTRAKHVFWSANPVGEMLYAMLDKMVAAGSKATMADLVSLVVTSAQFRNAAPNTPAAPAAAAKPPMNTAGLQPKNSDKVGTP